MAIKTHGNLFLHEPFCPTCARHKEDLEHAREILRRIHKGEPVDDGLNFWRGLLIGVPAGCAGWAVIIAIFRGVF